MRPRLPALLFATVLLGTACALEPKLQRWEEDFYYTERLYVDGQNQLAAQRYAKLRATAKDPRDADEAGLLQCEVQARAGEFAAAAACYDTLATGAQERSMRMRALLHAGELRYYELRKPNDAVAIWSALVERAGDEPAALRALDHLYLHGERDKSKRDAMVALFARLEKQNPRSEIADNLLLREAMLLETDGGKGSLQTAAELLERLTQEHPEAATYVECLMMRARVYRQLGDLQREARDLERLIDTFETSYVFASYSFSEHKVAALRLIELYRGPLANLPRAEHHARNLPNMLRKPIAMPDYLITLGEVQEQKGDRLAALGTYRSVLTFVEKRNRDYKANDHRICSELPTQEQAEACRREVDSYPDIEPKTCAVARERIAKLEDALRRPDLQSPGGKRPGGAP